MAIPTTAIRFTDALDPQEVLDFVFPMSPVLEAGEQIEAGTWTLSLLAEATALGLQIVTGDAGHPDPSLIEDNTAILAWFKVDPSFAGNVAFQGAGTALPMEVTIWSTALSKRKRQRTFLLTIREQ